MADTAVISCNGVTAILCPIDMVATSESRISSGLNNNPSSSPGNSMPVALPKPNALAYSVNL